MRKKITTPGGIRGSARETATDGGSDQRVIRTAAFHPRVGARSRWRLPPKARVLPCTPQILFMTAGWRPII